MQCKYRVSESKRFCEVCLNIAFWSLGFRYLQNLQFLSVKNLIEQRNYRSIPVISAILSEIRQPRTGLVYIITFEAFDLGREERLPTLAAHNCTTNLPGTPIIFINLHIYLKFPTN